MADDPLAPPQITVGADTWTGADLGFRQTLAFRRRWLEVSARPGLEGMEALVEEILTGMGFPEPAVAALLAQRTGVVIEVIGGFFGREMAG